MYTVPKLENYFAEALSNATQGLKDALQQEIVDLNVEVIKKKRDNDPSIAADLKAFRDRWFGRKTGILTQVNEMWLKGSSPEHKKAVGQIVNEIAAFVEPKVKETIDGLSAIAGFTDADFARIGTYLKKSLAEEPRVDISLPAVRRPIGAEHPIIKTMNEMVGIFRSLGYSVAEGPEIETDYYNFESLNFPPNHPARDTQDTLFIAGQELKPQRERLLLRTHTSPVQIRSMEKHKPPVRIVIPGKVHRSDTADATHSPIFHQIEGLAVDTNITFCDLKGTLDHAMKQLFGSSVQTRFFPSFFPFTEPSADVQISCFKCGGKGCRICKQSGWIEVLGCGMVDPKVFEFVKHNGYVPARVSGFAFGMGVERLAMLRYGIDDIQLFFHGDVRFLEQFA